ncbi:hypothetical protein PUN28_015874 [Cardiocondyla obscurior]|uniref:Uncharacterized protein n=1 Tax=Cardiocondyla obscurior TaxID=286306 RepID=A0AAW2EU10_9HYME
MTSGKLERLVYNDINLIYSDLRSRARSPRVLSRCIHRTTRRGVNDTPLVDPISAAAFYSYIPALVQSIHHLAQSDDTHVGVANHDVKHENFARIYGEGAGEDASISRNFAKAAGAVIF